MQFTIKLEESDESGYTVQCLELPAAISEGNTKEDAMEIIKEAIQLVLKVIQAPAQTFAEMFKVNLTSA